jgi:DnaJ family protein C protein 7
LVFGLVLHKIHSHKSLSFSLSLAYHNAVFHYTLAIETARSEVETSKEDPALKKQLASLYSNRAAASTMMRHYDEALADCDGAIHADCNYGKAYLRKAQLQLISGQLGDAIDTCNEVIQLDPDNACARDYRADILEMQFKFTSAKTFTASLYSVPQDSIHRQEIDIALTDVESVLSTCIAWNDLKVLKAELLWALGQSEEAYELTEKLLKTGGVVVNSSLHNLRAQIFVSMGRSEDAIRHLRLVLAHDRENERANNLFSQLSSFLALKAAADRAFKARKLDEALQKYELAMTMCPSQAYMAKLFFNHACTQASLHRHEAAIHDCSEAIRLNDEYIKAYMRRAACLRMRETDKPQQYELALRDYQTALSLCRTKHEKRNIVKKIKETNAELRELRQEELFKTEKLKRRMTESTSPKSSTLSSPDMRIAIRKSRTSSASSINTHSPMRTRTYSTPDVYISKSRTSSVSTINSS